MNAAEQTTTAQHPIDEFGRVVYAPQAATMNDLFGRSEPFVLNEKAPDSFYARISGDRPPEVPMSVRLLQPTQAVTDVLEQMNGICEDSNVWVQVILHGDVCTVFLKYNLILGSRLLATVPTQGLIDLIG